jgi:hypothetical protein
MATIERHPETGTKETRKAGTRLLQSRDALAAARADHGSIDEHAADLDTTALRKQSSAKVERLKGEHDDAAECVECELEGEPDKSAVVHHGRRDVLLTLDDEDDDKLIVADLGDDDEDD